MSLLRNIMVTPIISPKRNSVPVILIIKMRNKKQVPHNGGYKGTPFGTGVENISWS
jgi:hypothetical protein